MSVLANLLVQKPCLTNLTRLTLNLNPLDNEDSMAYLVHWLLSTVDGAH